MIKSTQLFDYNIEDVYTTATNRGKIIKPHTIIIDTTPITFSQKVNLFFKMLRNKKYEIRREISILNISDTKPLAELKELNLIIDDVECNKLAIYKSLNEAPLFANRTDALIHANNMNYETSQEIKRQLALIKNESDSNIAALQSGYSEFLHVEPTLLKDALPHMVEVIQYIKE